MAGPYGTPRTWAAGERPTAAQYNAELRDWTNALANPPACRIYNSAVQSCVNNVTTFLTFNSERWDTDTMHDTVTNSGRITIKTAGLYILTFTGVLAAAGDYSFVAAQFRLNGSTVLAISGPGDWPNGIDGPVMNPTTVYKFAVNDYVEVGVFQANAAAANRNTQVAGSYTTEFSATRIGNG